MMDLHEIRRVVIELALGLRDALAADAALDEGDKKRYQELNAQACKRADRVLVQLEAEVGDVRHLTEG